MDSREVVARAIEFRRPERLPISGFGEASDIIFIPYKQLPPPQAGGQVIDQWLCRWGTTEVPNMGQVKGHPLEDLAGMRDFPWPDGNDARRYEDVPRQLDEFAADPARRDKYVKGDIFMILWERMQALHGFENTMIALMENDRRMDELAERIVEYDIAVVRNMHRVGGTRIHGFGFTEDWGTETDLQISPELWRRFFFPRYKRLFAVIHECGWHIHMHSCGKINKGLPGLIEAGLDVVNMQQPLTNGIDEIGRQFAGKICFESLCDIQKTLPRGDHAAIEREAERLLHAWGTSEGGFILGDYGDEAAIGARPGTRQAMLETFRRLDPYRVGRG